MAFQTQNVGAETWKFIDHQIANATDWSLGQLIQKLEREMEEHPEVSTDIWVAIQLLETELDSRELDPVVQVERQIEKALAVL